MSHVTATNSNATSFPDVEIEYVDMVGVPFKPNGRWGSGFIDCLGVVLEAYNRAGFGLPDPATSAIDWQEFQDLFEEVSAADQLFDVVESLRGEPHLMVLVRLNKIASAGSKWGGYQRDMAKVRRLSGLKYWRLKTSVYPV